MKQKAKKFFTLLGLLLSIQSLEAQIRSTAISFGLGGAYPMGVKDLNVALKDNGYYEMQNRHSNINMEIMRLNKKFLYGIDANLVTLMATASGLNQPRNAYYRNYSFVPKIGFSPYVMEDFLYIYPTVGAGAGFTVLKRIPPNGTEASIITDRSWGMVLDGAVNVALYNPIPGDSDTQFVLGAAVGYRYCPLDKTWQNNKLYAHNTTSTSMSPQGLYFKVWMGMGKS
ncbi:MAG: hypothetical protein ACKVTZ_07910 [Bacteroidia bacterium]